MIKASCLNKLKIILVIIGLLAQLYDLYEHSYKYNFAYNPIIFSCLTLLFLCLERKYELPGFLLSTFTLLASWRLSDLAAMKYVIYIYAVVFVIAFIHFIILAKGYLQNNNKPEKTGLNTKYDWHLSFIRMYVGYDLVPHFSEKLFAGMPYRSDDIAAFTKYGVNDPDAMVLLAGVIEFLGSLSFSCGVFTRLCSVCLVICLMVATILGHHFDNGFIWADAGGGWEYPVLWSSIILSFAFFKPTTCSLDNYFNKNYILPKFIRALIS